MTDYRGNGRRIQVPGEMPPPMQISAPLNDTQLVLLMAAVLAPPKAERGEIWAAEAVQDALALYGNGCFQQGMGRISAIGENAVTQGRQAAARAQAAAEAAANQAEAEAVSPPADPPEENPSPPKLIITDGGSDG